MKKPPKLPSVGQQKPSSTLPHSSSQGQKKGTTKAVKEEQNIIDHDTLFKQLLQTFFREFLELFFKEMIEYVDLSNVKFMDKELFAGNKSLKKREVDLVAQVQFAGKESYFLVHVETESKKKYAPEEAMNRRMFRYFARLLDTYELPVYPIVIFSYDTPKLPEPNSYEMKFPDFEVLSFHYKVVQLSRLGWLDYVNNPNPIATALMAKMAIEPKDRPKVKLQCLRMLATLKLDWAKMRLISLFVDTYLKLTAAENEIFEQELAVIEPGEEKEQVMELMTSWKKEGIEEGLVTGRQEGRQVEGQTLVLRQLKKLLGAVKPEVASQVSKLSLSSLEELAEALFDFKSEGDLEAWLEAHKEEKAQ